MLLPAANDEQIWEYFATASIPDPDAAARVLGMLERGPASLLDIESSTGLRRGRLEALLKILAVDGVLAKNGNQWEATGTPYIHDHAKWQELARSRRAEANLMRRYGVSRLSLIHISEPTRLLSISYAVFCLKKKNYQHNKLTTVK